MTIGRFVKQVVARLAPRTLVYRGRGDGIALTFDDGPHPEQTPVLLDALLRLNVKATFFLQGAHASQWPQLVREMHARGHQVANHGWSHASAKRLPLVDFVEEVERTQSVLESIVGTTLARDFRPPYGDITMPAFWALARRRFRFVYWTVDSDDSVHRDAATLGFRMGRVNVKRGDILLFHEDYAHTVAAIPAVVIHLRSAGLSLQTVDRLLA